MAKLIVPFIAMLIGLSGCGFDGSYRYPCQDPANWGTEECTPPVCTVNGACPEDLVGKDIVDGTTTQTTIEDTQNG